MTKSKEESTNKTEAVEVTETNGTSDLTVYNFTRHGFLVEASSLEEAQEALEVHLKENKEEAK